VLGQSLGRLAGDDSSSAAAVEDEARGELRASRSKPSISADAQPSKGDGCNSPGRWSGIWIAGRLLASSLPTSREMRSRALTLF